MGSLNLFSLIYLVNFWFKIKAEDPKININMNCQTNYYYNSIEYKCDNCPSGQIYNNICYSATKKSIYGFGNTSPNNCPNGTILTELDDKGNHLGSFMCAETKPKITDSPENIPETSFSFNTFQDIKRPENGYSPKSFSLREFDQDEINYAIKSCEKGLYEKSCNYLANLCVLSMYNQNDDKNFCKRIFDFEKENTKYGSIISFNKDLSETKVNTSLESDNVYINKMDFYLAK